MKITLIHHQYRLRGGMESYLFNLVDGFLQKQNELEIITYKKDKIVCRQDKSRYKVRCWSSIKYCPRLIKNLVFAVCVKLLFKRKSSDLSISLTRTFNQDVVVVGGTHIAYAQKMNKRLGLRGRLEIMLEKLSFRCSKTIVAHSKMIKDEIIRFYKVDSKKIEVVYPPLDISKFRAGLSQRRAAFQEKYNINPSKITLLFSLTGDKVKGLQLLLAAIELLENKGQFEVIIAGNRCSIDLPGYARFLGFVETIEELYAAVDFTVVPSFYDAFGLVVVESLQCGTPVIVSAEVGAKELVGKGEGVIFKDLTPECIAQALMLANRQEFFIPDDIAKTKGLYLSQHIDKLLGLKG